MARIFVKMEAKRLKLKAPRKGKFPVGNPTGGSWSAYAAKGAPRKVSGC